MTTVTSKASILPLSLIFILVLGLTRPCVAGSTDQPEQIIRKMYNGRAEGTALHPQFSQADKPAAPQTVQVKDGVYCIRPTTRNNGELADGVLAVRQEPDKDLKIGFVIGYPERRDAVSSLYGLAKRLSANHWLYQEGMDSADPDARCAVDITLDQIGWHFATRKDAGCINDRGHDAWTANTGLPA